ncbi:hypothetical protein [Spirosoma koreense]
MTNPTNHRIALVLHTLAHPIRLRIIMGLTRPASIRMLQQRLQLDERPLTQHLDYLQENGLIRSDLLAGERQYALVYTGLDKAVTQLLMDVAHRNRRA